MTSLLFDSTLELCDPDGRESTAGYWFEALADGTSFGEPEPVEVAINSLIRDGALTQTESVGNREVTLLIQVRSSDGAGLADGVGALHRATGKRTTLVWTAPGDYAPPTVFDVETSSLHNPGDFDDLGWIENQQTYRLRLVCLPYSHSLAEFTDDASSPPGASAGTLFYAADTTTGWDTFGGVTTTKQFTVDAGLSIEGAGSVKSRVTEWQPGYISGTGNGTGGFYTPNGGTARDQITGLSLSTGTGGYVSVAIRFDPLLDASSVTRIYQSASSGPWTQVGGVAAIKVDANGFVHYRWAVAAGLTITGLRFESTLGSTDQRYNVPTPFVWYDDFRIATTATTEQSIVKQIYVEGSAPAPGSLHISSGNDSVALGPVLLITVPSAAIRAGSNPEGRSWATQGTLTADATAYQGSYYTPDLTTYSTAAGKPILNIPARILAPGPYTIVALVKSTGDEFTAGVQAQLNIGGTLAGLTSQAEVSLPAGPAGWQFVPVGTVYLPPVPVEGPADDTTVRMLFKGAPMANVYMIPAWLDRGRPVADFSIVDCGTGAATAAGSSSHLWIDSPSPSQPQGAYWRGPTPDRLNTRSAWADVRKPAVHQFPAGELSAFLTTAAQGPTLALRYSPAGFGPSAH